MEDSQWETGKGKEMKKLIKELTKYMRTAETTKYCNIFGNYKSCKKIGDIQIPICQICREVSRLKRGG